MKQLITILVMAVMAGCDSGGPAPMERAEADAGAGAIVVIVNGDFEQRADDGSIPGWMMLQHAGPPSYEMAIEAAAAYRGHGGFRMTRTHEQFYGTLAQDIPIPASLSGEIELSAMMKSKDVGAEGWKLMLITADVPQYSSSLVGTNDWQRLSVRAKLPPHTTAIRIGATLIDAGTGWVDDVQLKAIAQ